MKNTIKQEFGNTPVFLLNTHLNTVLEDAESGLNRLRMVLQYFEKRDDLLLLWRPHPLLEESLQSMQPQYLECYLQIKDFALKMKNLIYDTEAAAFEAICCSDAYIGDVSSSLVLSYGITGKPAYIWGFQNQASPRSQDIVKLGADEGDIEGDQYIFHANNGFGIFSVDLITKKVKLIGAARNKCPFAAYRTAVFYKGFVWLIPNYEAEIKKIDLSSGEEKIIPYPRNFSVPACGKFEISIKYGHYIWCVPQNADMILRIDMETDSIKEYSDFGQQVKKSPSGFLFKGGAVGNGKLWLCPDGSPVCSALDLENGVVSEFDVDCTKKRYGGVAFDGQHLWFAPLTADYILRFDPLTDTKKEYHDWPTGYVGGNYALYRPYFDGEFIWMTPRDANMIIKIDPKTEKITGLNKWPAGFERLYDGAYLVPQIFEKPVHCKEYIWFPTQRLNKLLGIHRYSNEMSSIDMEISIWDIEKNEYIFEQYLREYGLHAWAEHLYSYEKFSLSFFVDLVKEGRDMFKEKRKEDFSELADHSDGTAGECIWKHIAGELGER